jgi:ribosome recycling factor
VTEDILLEAMDKMAKAVEHTQGQFSTIRTGRAAPALVEKLLVEYYGSEVKPHDRAATGAIERAIRDSDLGINPTNDGTVLRLNFPPLTEERRKEYVKVVKHMAEDGRVAVRNLRRDARKSIEALEKSSEISKDDLERAEKELDKLTSEHVDDIDKALDRKEHELLEV